MRGEHGADTLLHSALVLTSFCLHLFGSGASELHSSCCPGLAHRYNNNHHHCQCTTQGSHQYGRGDDYGTHSGYGCCCYTCCFGCGCCGPTLILVASYSCNLLILVLVLEMRENGIMCVCGIISLVRVNFPVPVPALRQLTHHGLQS